MLKAWKIGSLFGIGLYIHWSFFLLPAYAMLSTADSDTGPLFMLAFVAVVAVCIVLHEYGHALTARFFGIKTRDITLYPIGGVARLEKMSEKPWEEFWIAVGGPAVNVIIAALLFVPIAIVAVVDPEWLMGTVEGRFLVAVFGSNVLLVLFNMIPAFPMDGGRVLRALLAAAVGFLPATRAAAKVAAVMALLMGLAGLGLFGSFLQNPMLILIAGFVFLAGQRELAYVEMRERERLDRETPIPVLPAPRRAAPAVPAGFFDLQPSIAVYTWDSATGSWVREPAAPPVRRSWYPEAQ
jgi:Zn-dependent protease